METPTFVHEKFVDENGYLTDVWKKFFELLLQNLKIDLGSEGFKISNQPSSNISLLNLTAGTIIYDSSSNEFKGKVGSVLKTFTLT